MVSLYPQRLTVFTPALFYPGMHPWQGCMASMPFRCAAARRLHVKCAAACHELSNGGEMSSSGQAVQQQDGFGPQKDGAFVGEAPPNYIVYSHV